MADLSRIISPRDRRWAQALREAAIIRALTAERYPWAADTFALPQQQLANYAQTTLASNILAGALSLSVVSAAGFPTAGNFMIRIDDAAPATTYEYCEVTAVAGTTFTVTRGQEGTTGIAHTAGAIIGNDLTAGQLGKGFVQKDFKARASMSGVQSYTSAVWNLANLVKEDDPNGNFDDVTHLYTAPVTGWYLAMANFNLSTATVRLGVRFIINASTAIGQNLTGQVTSGHVTTTQLIKLTAGDTLGVQGFEDASTGSLTCVADFEIMYVGLQ